MGETGMSGHDPSRDHSYYKRWDHEMDSYVDALRQGIQPTGTSQAKIDAAVQLSNELGRPV